MEKPSCCTGLCSQLIAAYNQAKMFCPTTMCNLTETSVCKKCNRTTKEIIMSDYTLKPSYPNAAAPPGRKKTGTSSS